MVRQNPGHVDGVDIARHGVWRAANLMKVLMQHVQEEPMPPSHRTELKILGAGVDEFVLACLRKDPKRRPASAEELLQMASTCKTADLWD